MTSCDELLAFIFKCYVVSPPAQGRILKFLDLSHPKKKRNFLTKQFNIIPFNERYKAKEECQSDLCR